MLQLFRPRRNLSLTKKRAQATVALSPPDGEEQPLKLVRAKATAADRVLVHFEGVDDRDGAERLLGCFVDVDPTALPTCLTDEFDYAYGLEVQDQEGRALGAVVDIRDNGAQPLLIVGEEEVMIPAPLVEVIEADRVRVEIPEGLLEVNRE